MAETHTEFVESPSGEDRVMNNALSDHMSDNSDKIIAIARDSITGDGDEIIHGWQVTIEVE